MTATLLAAAGTFAATNLDDLLLLVTVFVAVGGRGAAAAVLAGQYLGMAALIALGALGALGLSPLPVRWAGLLGVVPLLLGIRGLLAAGEGTPHDTAPGLRRGPFWSVAGLTLAGGGDNLSVYIPYFRGTGAHGVLVFTAVTAVLVPLWCLAASRLARAGVLRRALQRVGRRAVPVLFIGLGAALLSGAFGVPGIG